jgi:hypothetical protein
MLDRGFRDDLRAKEPLREIDETAPDILLRCVRDALLAPCSLSSELASLNFNWYKDGV